MGNADELSELDRNWFSGDDLTGWLSRTRYIWKRISRREVAGRSTFSFWLMVILQSPSSPSCTGKFRVKSFIVAADQPLSS